MWLLAVLIAADVAGRGPVVGAVARAPASGPRTYAVNAIESVSGVPSVAAPKVAPVFVGPLFPRGLTSGHTCTASVVDSPGGNVILTAAHCISGPGVGMTFAPGYSYGRAGYGTWTVTAAYVHPTWNATQSPDADFAFLTVAPSTSNRTAAPVQSVVGAASLGGAPHAGTVVTVAAYAAGINDSAIMCTAATTDTDADPDPVPTFTCGRFPSGTSGGPWIEQSASGAVVDGVIGGLHQGGCTDPTSYTARFGASVHEVLKRAISAAPPDRLSSPGSNGC